MSIASNITNPPPTENPNLLRGMPQSPQELERRVRYALHTYARAHYSDFGAVVGHMIHPDHMERVVEMIVGTR